MVSLVGSEEWMEMVGVVGWCVVTSSFSLRCIGSSSGILGKSEEDELDTSLTS